MTPLKPIQSSTIHSAAHDATTGTLAVRFLDGKGQPSAHVYHYQNVPAHIAEGLFTAGSAGVYHASHIRGHFAHTKLDA